MASFAFDRLFQDGLAVGARERNLDAKNIIGSYSPELRRAVSAAMAEVIVAEANRGAVELEHADGAASPPSQFDSAIFRLRSGDAVQQIVFLRIKDAAVEALVPLVSLAVAAYSGDLKALVSGAEALKALWSHLVTLRRDKDSTAIDVYEALVAARAAGRVTHQGPPTTATIAGGTRARTLDDVVAGLKRLKELNLIDVARWGGQEGDTTSPDNTWEVRL
jgi:hypothetical protein